MSILPVEIEGDVHAVYAAYERVMTPEEALGHPREGQAPESTGKNSSQLEILLEIMGINTLSREVRNANPPRGVRVAEAAARAMGEPEADFLVDACNRFNEINH